MGIAFNQISLNILTPGVFAEFDSSRATRGAQSQPHDVMLLGQMLSGSGAASTVYAIESEDEGRTLFGAKSQLSQMITAYKAVDRLTPLYAIGVADGTTAALGSITVSGTATEGGEIVVYIGGTRIPIAVSKNDTASTIETNGLLEHAKYPYIPVAVAGNTGDGFDYTASCKGSIGNQIFLGVCKLPGERVPAGLTVTVTAMASGATDPSYTAAIALMGEDQYHTIACGLCTDTVLDALEAELESRWAPMRAIEGFAFSAIYDSRANLTTFGNARNSLTSIVKGLETSATLPLPWEVAAADAAISALQAQVDPSRAMTGISYPGYSAAPRGVRFTRAQRDILLSDGISTALAGSDGRLRVERFVTTYQTNNASVPDTAYQDLTTVRLLAALRYSLRVRIGTKFARFKLADNDSLIPAGQPIVTPNIIRAEIISLFQDWQDLGWVENLQQFKDQLLVERDGNDPNRVNCILPPDLINNLLVTAAQIAFKR